MKRAILNWTGLITVGFSAAILTFNTLRTLAEACGFHGWLSWLLPISVDAARAVATNVRLTGNDSPRAVRFARAWALTAAGVSLVGNATEHGLSAYGMAAPWWVAVAVSVVAPLALVGTVHLMVLLSAPATVGQRPIVATPDPRSTRASSLTSNDGPGRLVLPHSESTGPVTYPEEVMQATSETGGGPDDAPSCGDIPTTDPVAELLAQNLGRRQLAARLGVSEYQARQLIAASGNGDPPEPPLDLPAPATHVHQRRPILRPWMRDPAEFRALLVWLARYGAHACGFHLARAPLYFARLVARSPRGGWIVVRGFWVWVWHMEQRPLRLDTVRRGDTPQYLHLSKLQKERVRHRRIMTGAVFVPVAVGVVLFVLIVPVVWRMVSYVVVVLVLGVVGTSADRRVTDRATVSPYAPAPLRADVVVEALQSLDIAAMNAKNGSIGFPAPIRKIGSGWLASIDLPLGVTPTMIMDRRQQLASGLRRPVGCVWPDADHEAHGGRLELTVLKVEMSKARQRAYPMRKSGSADIFAELPFGTDQRGRPVAIPLIESNLLIGSLPGAGKTASSRCVLLGCALDPTVELHIHELKGSGDLEALERVSHAYGSGVDDHTIERCLDGLRGLLGELERRAEQLNGSAPPPGTWCPTAR